MAKTIRSSAVLGSAKAGLTLTAQLKDDAGVNVAATWSIVEVGAGGNYEATSIDAPDSFTGGVVRFTGTGVDVMDRDGVTISLLRQVTGVLAGSGGVTGLQWQRGGGGYRTGDAVKLSFLTYDGTNAPVALAALPTAKVRRNGADDLSVSVAVTSLGGGHYEAAFTVPVGWAINDDVQVVPRAVFVSGYISETPYSLGPLDSKAVGQLQDAPVLTGFATPANVTAAKDAILDEGGPGPWTTGGGSGDCPTVEEIEEHLATLHGAGAWGGTPAIEISLTQPVIEVAATTSTIEVAMTQTPIEILSESPSAIEIVNTQQIIEVQE